MGRKYEVKINKLEGLYKVWGVNNITKSVDNPYVC